MPGMFPFRVAIAFAIVASVTVSAQTPIKIRLATLAPDNSPWASALRSMGASWKKATDGRVELIVLRADELQQPSSF